MEWAHGGGREALCRLNEVVSNTVVMEQTRTHGEQHAGGQGGGAGGGLGEKVEGLRSTDWELQRVSGRESAARGVQSVECNSYIPWSRLGAGSRGGGSLPEVWDRLPTMLYT